MGQPALHWEDGYDARLHEELARAVVEVAREFARRALLDLIAVDHGSVCMRYPGRPQMMDFFPVTVIHCENVVGSAEQAVLQLVTEAIAAAEREE